MESRNISTIQILQQIQSSPVVICPLPYQVPAITPMQAELNRIASQPENFAFGLGVALRKAYLTLSVFCAAKPTSSLVQEFSDLLVAAFLQDSSLTQAVSHSLSTYHSQPVNECLQSADEFKRLADCFQELDIAEKKFVKDPTDETLEEVKKAGECSRKMFGVSR